MKIVCISDTHTMHSNIIIPKDADIIIHAGDFTYQGLGQESLDFLRWFKKLRIKHKILIFGNHEVHNYEMAKLYCEENNITLLHNSHVVIDGYKIFGSPNSNKFGHGWAYNSTESELKDIYATIDDDVDIVVTHGPSFGNLDKTRQGLNVGSIELNKRLSELKNLKLHVTGHIHEDRGTKLCESYLCVNASICGIPYSDIIVNPITVVL